MYGATGIDLTTNAGSTINFTFGSTNVLSASEALTNIEAETISIQATLGELSLDGDQVEIGALNGMSLSTSAGDVTVTIGSKVISVEAMYDALVAAGML